MEASAVKRIPNNIAHVERTDLTIKIESEQEVAQRFSHAAAMGEQGHDTCIATVEVAWKYLMAHPASGLREYYEVVHITPTVAKLLYELKSESAEKLGEFVRAISLILCYSGVEYKGLDGNFYQRCDLTKYLTEVLLKEAEKGLPGALSIFAKSHDLIHQFLKGDSHYQFLRDKFASTFKKAVDELGDAGLAYQYAKFIFKDDASEQDHDYYRYMMLAADKGRSFAQKVVLEFRETCPLSVKVPDALFEKCTYAYQGPGSLIDLIKNLLDKACSKEVKGRAAFYLAQSCDSQETKETYLQIAIANHYQPAIWQKESDIFALVNLIEYSLIDSGPREIAGNKAFLYFEQAIVEAKKICGKNPDAHIEQVITFLNNKRKNMCEAASAYVSNLLIYVLSEAPNLPSICQLFESDTGLRKRLFTTLEHKIFAKKCIVEKFDPNSLSNNERRTYFYALRSLGNAYMKGNETGEDYSPVREERGVARDVRAAIKYLSAYVQQEESKYWRLVFAYLLLQLMNLEEYEACEFPSREYLEEICKDFSSDPDFLEIKETTEATLSNNDVEFKPG